MFNILNLTNPSDKKNIKRDSSTQKKKKEA